MNVQVVFLNEKAKPTRKFKSNVLNIIVIQYILIV